MIAPIRSPADAAPPRLGALAKLPLFFDLMGKRAIVAGGTAPAAWKAELLAASGADVQIYATELCDEMRALLARGAASGSLTHIPRAWNDACLVGCAIALADAGSDEEASAFFSASRAAGVPVNVIDKPAYCQFQFGSIVNRSPVVIGISTDGGAPILGQAIRRRIETLLPATLSVWGAYAKEIRDAVTARLNLGSERRAFWERLAERAFSGERPSSSDPGCDIDDIRSEAPITGRVTLVGAGPGDAELLTIKAVRAMQAADVILHDDLVSDDVLELARREAKRMTVGKRGRRDSCAQSDINALMIKLATQGKRVVRLKSGDPMIFGRAGEEIAELDRHGIPVEVVPGVTSALAAAACLGVSLTHRDFAHSVRFVTGHSRNGKVPDNLDWSGLADPRTTLIFYMGLRTAPSIAARLTEAGLAAQTPAVIVASATRPGEKRWRGVLATLDMGCALIGTDAPALIGIGSAFVTARPEIDARPGKLGLDETVRLSACA